VRIDVEKFLVLGGCGYIGSHFVEKLVDKKIDFVVVDNLDSGVRNRIPENVKFYKIDAKETDQLHQILVENQISSVVHLAAKKQARESMRLPFSYWDENLRTTLSLINAVRKSDVRSILFSSSCSVYGNSGKVNDDTKSNPQSTYAKTKLACEELLKDCSNEIGYSLGILRYFNVIGAAGFHNSDDQASEAVLPSFIKKTLSHEPLDIHGNEFDTPDGTAVRDYVDVRDLSEAHLKVANLLAEGLTPFFECRVSTGQPKSVLEVAQEVFIQTGITNNVNFTHSAPGDPAKIWSEVDLQLLNLGWHPQHAFSESVKSQIDAMLRHNSYDWN
jgi:UDP-glucose 4-epimerase